MAAQAVDRAPFFEPFGLLGGPTRASFVRDGLAFVGVGARLAVVDVRDVTRPRLLGAVTLADDIVSIQVDGAHAYVGTAYYAGLVVVDVSDPGRPRQVASWPCGPEGCGSTPGWADELAVADDVLYAPWSTLVSSFTSSELAIVDVSEPARPRKLAGVTPPGFVYPWSDIAVTSGRAFVAGGYDGLRVFDVAAPSAPVQVGAWAGHGHASDVVVRGRHAFLVEDGVPQGGVYPAENDPDAVPGIRVLDIGSPGDPRGVGFLRTEGPIRDLALLGDHLALSEHLPDTARWQTEGGVRIVDIHDPAHPSSAAWYPFAAATGIGDAVLASPGDGRLYATGNGREPSEYTAAGSEVFAGLWTLDAADPVRALPVLGCFDDAGFEEVRDIAARKGIAYAAAGADGCRVLDVGGPSPVELGAVDLPKAAEAVAVDDEHAYVATGQGGLYVLDLERPASPILSGTLDGYGSGGRCAVAAAGDRVYVGLAGEWQAESGGPVRDGGLRVVDVSDPARPHEVGWLDLGPIVDLAVDDGPLVVAGSTTVRILDRSARPGAPEPVGAYTTTDTVWQSTLSLEIRALAVRGSEAYLALGRADAPFTFDGGLAVVSIADPRAPRRLGYTRAVASSGVEPSSVVVVGAAVCLGERLAAYKYYGYPSRVEAFDVSRPDVPRSLGASVNSLRVGALAADGGRLLAAGRDVQVLRAGWSVAGLLLDERGRPVSGVRVATAAGGVSSGADGSFALHGLGPDQHDIEPQDPDLLFDPPRHTVITPPDRAGLRFTAQPAAASILLSGGPAPAEATLRYTDTQHLSTSLVFPTGVVTAPTRVTVRPATPVEAPAERKFAYHAFELVAERGGAALSDLGFARPVTVDLAYSDADAWSSMPEASLLLLRREGVGWVEPGSECPSVAEPSVDVVTNRVTTWICRTGRYALFATSRRFYLPLALRP